MKNKVTISDMRMALAQRDLDQDDGSLLDLFLDGCEGYNNMPATEIEYLYKYSILNQDD
jgi:hypothetical protein